MPHPKPKSVHYHASLLAARHRRRADRLCAPFTADDWLLLLWRSQGRCYLCKKPMPPDDRSCEHLVPMVDGGSDAFRNIAVAHKRCAAAKGRKSVYEVLTPAEVHDLHRRLHGPESTDERLLRTMVMAAAEELGVDAFDDVVSALLLALFARLSDSRGKAVLAMGHEPDPEPEPEPDLDPVAQHVFAAAASAHRRTHALRPPAQAA